MGPQPAFTSSSNLSNTPPKKQRIPWSPSMRPHVFNTHHRSSQDKTQLCQDDRAQLGHLLKSCATWSLRRIAATQAGLPALRHSHIRRPRSCVCEQRRMENWDTAFATYSMTGKHTWMQIGMKFCTVTTSYAC